MPGQARTAKQKPLKPHEYALNGTTNATTLDLIAKAHSLLETIGRVPTTTPHRRAAKRLVALANKRKQPASDMLESRLQYLLSKLRVLTG